MSIIIVTSAYQQIQDASGLVVPQNGLNNCLCPINSYLCNLICEYFLYWHYLWQQCQVFKIASNNEVCVPFIPRVTTLGLPGKQIRFTMTDRVNTTRFSSITPSHLSVNRELAKTNPESKPKRENCRTPGGFSQMCSS